MADGKTSGEKKLSKLHIALIVVVLGCVAFSIGMRMGMKHSEERVTKELLVNGKSTAGGHSVPVPDVP